MPGKAIPTVLLIALACVLYTPSAAAVNLKFEKCSSSKTKSLKTAFSAASTMASNGDTAYTDNRDKLEANPNGWAPYNTYFGTYSSARGDTVAQILGDVVALFGSSDGFVLSCDDKDPECDQVNDDFAFSEYGVNKITFCAAYWKQNDAMRALTIVHEMTHIVADTKDHANGEKEVEALAKNDPDEAVDNADSYGWYANQF